MVVDVDSDGPPAPAAPPRPGAAAATIREAEFLWELRKYVLLLATLAASVTYSAGLSPPGGFWPDNDPTGARLAGDPVLRVTYARRYQVFFYCNATSFVASVVIVNLLLAHSLSRRRWWLRALQAAMILDQFGLMGAYAAGSSREVDMSAYILALVAMVSSYVCAHVLLFTLCAAVRARHGDASKEQGEQSAVAPDAEVPVVAPDREGEAPESVERTRKYLLIFATLAATVTYQAGLSTPGGFLSADSVALAPSGDRHLAGDPVLRGHHPARFMAFFYFNTTAFVASLVVIMLLMSRTVTRHGFRSYALWVCTALALVGLTGAFAVGCSRTVKTSVYVVALVGGVLLYIGVQVLVFLCEPVKNLLHRVQDKMSKYLRLNSTIHSQNPQDDAAAGFTNQCHHQQRNGNSDSDPDLLLRKTRMYLLLLGILAATVTYEAGLNPPGGFWQSDASSSPTDGAHHYHYRAGDPVLHITYPRRYLVFFYCNATAFVASLVVLTLLLSNIFSTQGIKYCALQVAMILDLFGLIGAYAAGSCRQGSKTVYVSVLVVPVFLYISIHVLVFMMEVSPSYATWRTAVMDKLARRVPERVKEVFRMQAVEEDEDTERKLEKSRKLLLLLAILAASLTYQAGMNPPGGFWQEKNKAGFVVGNPTLNDNYRRRYLAFFYCNATAFVASLAIIMLLVNRKLSRRGVQSRALLVCVVLVLMGLMGAFAAGSCRKVSTSIYVFVLVLAVLLCIAVQVAVVVSESVRGFVRDIFSKFDLFQDEGPLPLTSSGAGRGPPQDIWNEKLPKYLLLLAALAAAVTYQAAMNPPGGLWGDDQTSHTPGDPILRSSHPHRYKAFFYCNATSFMASLVIMVLLLIKRVSKAPPALLALHAAMILDLFGLMGAYATGCSRRKRTSAYILALVVGVSAYIVVLVFVSIGVARWLKGVVDEIGERLTRCFSVEDL